MDWGTSLKGKILKGQYQIDYKAGQGGMSWLYKVTHTLLQQDMALKLLYPQLTEDARTRRRFIDEAKIQFQLRHPNIVRVTEIIQEHTLLGIVQEWVHGTDLKSYLRHLQQLMDLGEIRYILEHILDALDHAHQRGIVHRDIKPSNILLALAQEGIFAPKLSDFGVAKILDSLDERTSSGMVVGTLKYAAPEQIKASRAIDHRADIYSLGVTVYQLTTGRLPFNGPLEKLLYMHLYEPPVPPSEHRPDLTPEMDAVLLKALAKDPDDRFQSCKEFAEALDCFPPTQPIAGHPRFIKRAPDENALDLAALVKSNVSGTSTGTSSGISAYKQGSTKSSALDVSRPGSSADWLKDDKVGELFDKVQTGPDTQERLAEEGPPLTGPTQPTDSQELSRPTANPLSVELPEEETGSEELPPLPFESYSMELPSIDDEEYKPPAPAPAHVIRQSVSEPKQASVQEAKPSQPTPQAHSDDDLVPPSSGKGAAFFGALLALVLVGGLFWWTSQPQKTIADKGSASTTPDAGPPPKSPTSKRPLAPPSLPRRAPAASGNCQDGEQRSCFGGTDSQKGIGSCRPGKQTCKGGSFGPCVGATLPQKESCNGKDDDCDGKVDNVASVDAKSCFRKRAGCRYKGVMRCYQGALRCRSLRPAPRAGYRALTMRLSPTGTKFRIRAAGRTYAVRGRLCVELRGRQRVTVSSPRHQLCVFQAPTRRTLSIKMKPKSDLEDVPNYCVR